MKKLNLILVMALGVFVFSGCDSMQEITPAKLQEETARVQPQVQDIATAVQGQELTGDELADWIALLQVGNAASTPFNPYAIPIGAGLTALSAILGAFARKKSIEADTYAKKYKAHKQGVELTMKECSASDISRVRLIESNLYENIGEARKNNGV